jgi:hypothetical protein
MMHGNKQLVLLGPIVRVLLLTSMPSLLFSQVRGGMNYDFLKPTPYEAAINSFAILLANPQREIGGTVGTIFNYDIAKDTIDADLQSMFDGGQRRLRLFLWTLSSGDGYQGAYIVAPGGAVPQRFLDNLTNLLASIRRIGFEEIIFVFGPLGDNQPFGTSFPGQLYQDNWTVIQSVRPILLNAGIPYTIDLFNEGIPDPEQTQLIAYTQLLWKDYTAAFGSGDTLGFSIIANNPSRLPQIPLVYGSNPPSVFDLHIYENPGATFTTALATLAQLGYRSVDWILGEVFYDDPISAEEFRTAMTSQGRPIRFLVQWPSLDDGNRTYVAPPLFFTAYAIRGY